MPEMSELERLCCKSRRLFAARLDLSVDQLWVFR
jgi:hypothetical protein